jgi:hypothetical protein
MPFLFQIPSDIFNNVFTDWISMWDILNVDSAHCNHDERANFIGLLQSPDFVLNKSASKMKWLNYRQVKAKDLFVKAGNIIFLRQNVSFMSKVVSISFSDNGISFPEKYRMIESINSYENLTKLQFLGCADLNVETLSQIKDSVLLTLSHFSIIECNDFNNAEVKFISKHCQNVVSFELYVVRPDVEVNVLIQLVENNFKTSKKLYCTLYEKQDGMKLHLI